MQVVGPAGALQALTEAITEPVLVAGASGPITETVTVGSPDPVVRLETPQNARVTVNVTPAPIQWSVTGVAVQVHNATRAVQIVPKTVTVVVHGPREPRPLGGGFRCVGGRERVASRAVRSAGEIVPPARVGVVSIEPARVRVRIR